MATHCSSATDALDADVHCPLRRGQSVARQRPARGGQGLRDGTFDLRDRVNVVPCLSTHLAGQGAHSVVGDPDSGTAIIAVRRHFHAIALWHSGGCHLLRCPRRRWKRPWRGLPWRGRPEWRCCKATTWRRMSRRDCHASRPFVHAASRCRSERRWRGGGCHNRRRGCGADRADADHAALRTSCDPSTDLRLDASDIVTASCLLVRAHRTSARKRVIHATNESLESHFGNFDRTTLDDVINAAHEAADSSLQATRLFVQSRLAGGEALLYLLEQLAHGLLKPVRHGLSFPGFG
mmetsp:Transcript_107500/g.302569  ORF Transcript_107500/g.302569 Transcript_107500/m.302569 type:complete len:293 (+) Transcript_107500:529-1407(+)